MPSADDCARGLEPPKTHKASINESQATLAQWMHALYQAPSFQQMTAGRDLNSQKYLTSTALQTPIVVPAPLFFESIALPIFFVVFVVKSIVIIVFIIILIAVSVASVIFVEFARRRVVVQWWSTNRCRPSSS